MTTGDQWSGLWKFRNRVNKLVDHNGKSEVVDWTIDYFLYLKVTDGKVSGTLFGANDVEKADQSGNSQSYATINGTLSRRGELDIELTFSSGTSDNGSEHLRCKLAGETFVGKLEKRQTPIRFSQLRWYDTRHKAERISVPLIPPYFLMSYALDFAAANW